MEENKYIVALGYISTCVPEMEIDVENPLDMMIQVYNKFDQLRSRVAELEAERDALSESKKRTEDQVYALYLSKEFVEGERDALKAENERLRKALEAIREYLMGGIWIYSKSPDEFIKAALAAKEG